MVIRNICEPDRIVLHAFAWDSLSRQDIIPIVDKLSEDWIAFKQFLAFISDLAAKAFLVHWKTNLSTLHREVTLYSKKHTVNLKGFGGKNAELWFVILDYNACHWPISFQLLRQPDVSRQVRYTKTLRFDHRVTRRQNPENGNFSYRCQNLKSRKV
jgi:hypothetical protein